MDKIKLKKCIKSFANNVGSAAAIFALSLFYLLLIITGRQAGWGWLVLDIIICGFYTFFAITDWKKIKAMLEESE